ncbi:MAG: glycosyltransferase [Chthoniobacterales bacterium]
MKRKRIVVMGFMGSIPIAGVIWQHIHYIVGLQRLGHDVYYIEDSARLPYNPQTFDTSNDYSYAAKVLAQLAGEFGFENRWSFCARYLPGKPTAGLRLMKIQQLYLEADAILNVCGTQEFNDDLLRNNSVLYVESDPGVEQIKVDKKIGSTIEYLSRHRALFTFGENVGTRRFPVPLHKLRWLPTRQPVVTDFWRTRRAAPASAVFTSIANWSTSGLKDIQWRGEKYLWSKSREFLRFVTAPKKSDEPFELATDIKDEKTRTRFLDNGWRFCSPHQMSVDYWQYRDYIRRSKGEFTVAKDQYVRLRTGWFSDRSACYLAAGRPVITQETGFTDHYGNDGGLFAFKSLGEIAEAVRQINADYNKQSRAARAVACEIFEAEKVLSQLLDRAGI